MGDNLYFVIAGIAGFPYRPARKLGTIQGLGPDGKAEVSVEYHKGKPARIAAVVLSCQHDEEKDPEELRKELTRSVIVPALRELPGVRSNTCRTACSRTASGYCPVSWRSMSTATGSAPNEADGGLVRFIDSEYNTLFHVPDGENIILTTFGDDRRILPCRYIDATHARIGGETFHICQFAEVQERNGAVYAPEHPKEGDVCDTYTIYQLKDASAASYAFMPYSRAGMAVS